jgi:two-component system sensor histidine kinase UhpB
MPSERSVVGSRAFIRWLSRGREYAGSLQVQAILWTVLPLGILVAALLLAGGVIYQQVVRSLVEQRDQELARVSAVHLSDNIQAYANTLVGIASREDIQSGDTQLQRNALDQARSLLLPFDGGILVTDAEGRVAVAEPYRPEVIGQDLSSLPYFQTARALRQPIFSDIFQERDTGEETLIVAVPMLDQSRQFLGVIAGSFLVKQQGLGEDIRKLKLGEGGYAYLVDRNGRVIYHADSGEIGKDYTQFGSTQEMMRGKSGAVLYEPFEGEIWVVGYAVVPATGWGLVIREPWAHIVGEIEDLTRLLAVFAVACLILFVVLTMLGARALTRPIQALVSQASRAKVGDYSVRVPERGPREIRGLSVAFNEMMQQIARYRTGLRSYVAAITRSQEEERKRVARDLHDDTVQALVALSRRLELCQDHVNDPSKMEESLDSLQKLVTDTIQGVRQFSRDLRPSVLEDLGLVPALHRLAEGDSGLGEAAVDFRVVGAPVKLAPDMELSLFRIAQEALSNVRRHAEASRVAMELGFREDEVILSVEDDGVGFQAVTDLTDLVNEGHFGLMGIRERVDLYDGSLSIESGSVGGTRTLVRLPLGSSRGGGEGP